MNGSRPDVLWDEEDPVVEGARGDDEALDDFGYVFVVSDFVADAKGSARHGVEGGGEEGVLPPLPDNGSLWLGALLAEVCSEVVFAGGQVGVHGPCDEVSWDPKESAPLPDGDGS